MYIQDAKGLTVNKHADSVCGGLSFATSFLCLCFSPYSFISQIERNAITCWYCTAVSSLEVACDATETFVCFFSH